MPTLRELLREQGIALRQCAEGNQKTTCPKCSNSRKNKTDPCLSVTIDLEGAVWKCHNCGWADGVREQRHDPAPQPRRREPVTVKHTPSPRSAAVDAWFLNDRGIPAPVLDRNDVGLDGSEITFPFKRAGETVNIKFRAFGEKRFRQVKDAEKVYFGLDDIANQSTVIICEGEIDKLSIEVAGFQNAVSVPDGAPKQAKAEIPDPDEDTKFSYVWNCKAAFENVTKIILATDGDGPGEALAEELARRYGKHRCWQITWPSGNDVRCKDANDVLVANGPEALREVIERARPYPIKSLHDAEAFETTAIRLFRGETAQSFPTDWPNLDKHYRVRPGELTAITGAPGSGKSQFIDALTMNLAERHGWKFALCSFENPAAHHIAKLAELHLDKPFWPGPRGRMPFEAAASNNRAASLSAWGEPSDIIIDARETCALTTPRFASAIKTAFAAAIAALSPGGIHDQMKPASAQASRLHPLMSGWKLPSNCFG